MDVPLVGGTDESPSGTWASRHVKKLAILGSLAILTSIGCVGITHHFHATLLGTPSQAELFAWRSPQFQRQLAHLDAEQSATASEVDILRGQMSSLTRLVANLSSRVPSAPEWTTVVELNSDGTAVTIDRGPEAFNALFAACPVVQYIFEGSVHSVYVRRTGRAYTGSAYDLFTENWVSANNLNHQDFDIYSSLADARSRTSPWGGGNYDDPDVGYPRDFGGGCRWFTMPGGRFPRAACGRLDGGAKFQIYTGNDCPASHTQR